MIGLKEAGCVLRPNVLPIKTTRKPGSGAFSLFCFEEEKGWVAKDQEVKQIMSRGKRGGK